MAEQTESAKVKHVPKRRHKLIEIPPGSYHATIAKVDIDRQKGVINLELALWADAMPELYAEEGSINYCVICTKNKVFTAMGANNIHHAANKATKLWKDKWDGILRKAPRTDTGWRFVPVKEFGQLMKEKK